MFVINSYEATSRTFDLFSVPIIKNDDELTILWVDDFHDGPLSGVCTYKNEKLWFQIYDDRSLFGDEETRGADRSMFGGAEPAERLLLLYRLRPEQFTEAEKWNDLFKTQVGTHWDGTIDPEQRCLRPRSDWEAFYTPYQQLHPLLDLADVAVVALWIQGMVTNRPGE